MKKATFSIDHATIRLDGAATIEIENLPSADVEIGDADFIDVASILKEVVAAIGRGSLTKARIGFLLRLLRGDEDIASDLVTACEMLDKSLHRWSPMRTVAKGGMDLDDPQLFNAGVLQMRSALKKAEDATVTEQTSGG